MQRQDFHQENDTMEELVQTSKLPFIQILQIRVMFRVFATMLTKELSSGLLVAVRLLLGGEERKDGVKNVIKEDSRRSCRKSNPVLPRIRSETTGPQHVVK